MVKTRRPRNGGILTILSGAFGLLGATSYAIGFGGTGSGFAKGDVPPFVPSIIFGVPIISIVIGILALVGGIFAMRRKRWQWALTGAIAATLSFILLGIPAIILISLSRDEFSS